MSNTFDIQPIGRFVGQSAAIKRPRVCCVYFVVLVKSQCLRAGEIHERERRLYFFLFSELTLDFETQAISSCAAWQLHLGPSF